MLSSGFVFFCARFFVEDNDDGSHIVDGKFIFRFFFSFASAIPMLPMCGFNYV